MYSKQQWSTLTLITSGDIQGTGGLTYTDFDLTGAFLSSKDSNVVW